MLAALTVAGVFSLPIGSSHPPSLPRSSPLLCPLQVNNLVLFNKDAYNKLINEVPKYKMISTSGE
jgi:hypothetical protein